MLERLKTARTLRSERGVKSAHVRAHCELDENVTQLLRVASEKGSLSARVTDRVARVARTVADLAVKANLSDVQEAEAIG